MSQRPPTMTEYRHTKPPASAKGLLRGFARSSSIFLMSLPARISAGRKAVSFPLYHHVFDDERDDFDRHLRFFRDHGDLISIDDAISALANPAGLSGSFFCITFDDGFRNCLTNATEILLKHNVSGAFFLPTDYIGVDLDSGWDVARRFFEGSGLPRPTEFLDWDQCRQMLAAGMKFGAHTCAHRRLSSMSTEQAERELRDSKAIIERELGVPCEHFAAPWGQPTRDFDPNVHPDLARRLGFKSFFTTRRGPNYVGADPFALRREVFVAKDPSWMLRYFLSRDN